MDEVKLGQEVEIYCYDQWRKGIVSKSNSDGSYSIDGEDKIGNIDGFEMHVVKEKLIIEPDWRDKIGNTDGFEMHVVKEKLIIEPDWRDKVRPIKEERED